MRKRKDVNLHRRSFKHIRLKACCYNSGQHTMRQVSRCTTQQTLLRDASQSILSPLGMQVKACCPQILILPCRNTLYLACSYVMIPHHTKTSTEWLETAEMLCTRVHGEKISVLLQLVLITCPAGMANRYYVKTLAAYSESRTSGWLDVRHSSSSSSPVMNASAACARTHRHTNVSSSWSRTWLRP